MEQKDLANGLSKVKTRLIAMGSRPLMEGFALLGFETFPNATLEDLEQTLSDLSQSGEKALLLLETYLSQSNISLLADVREHGGFIIVTEIPAINASQDYHPFVEDLVLKVLGNHALDNKSLDNQGLDSKDMDNKLLDHKK